ncbi:unnamed protein product [Phytophthora fragariaefolia]|uniref:Unnamed protein product n=1 Tax=Phytophthora fragariaefolia TaxID=1490495 RepID=A0A9W7D2H0_9STRA|nr:unnamed protein product [Phytophthora fragariaefolia]
MDLEDKPRPPQVPSGTPAGLDENLDPPDESPPVQAGANTSIQPRSADQSQLQEGTAYVPDQRCGDACPPAKNAWRTPRTCIATGSWIDQTVGHQCTDAPTQRDIIAESFEAEALFDLKLGEIKQSVQSLFELLAPLVGEPDQVQKQSTQSKSTRSTLTVARSTPIVAPGDQTAASSPYVSATEEVESSDSEEPPRMALGPAGAAMLQNRAKQTAGRTTINPRDTREALANSNRHPPEKLKSFFQAAMERFLKEQQVPQTRPKPRSTGDQDVEMESGGSPDRPTTAWEYDPDDHDLGRPARATIATTTATESNQAINTPWIRVSAMSELKEFAGRDGDEDRARSWLGKVNCAAPPAVRGKTSTRAFKFNTVDEASLSHGSITMPENDLTSHLWNIYTASMSRD